MDSFLKTAMKGTTLCPEAITALALDAVSISHPTEDFPVPLSRMKKHYTTAVKIRVVAKNLGRTTLEQSCKLLLELVDFAARYKCKKRLKFNYTEKDILTTMGTNGVTLGDKNNTDICERLIEGILAARSGDVDMLHLLGLNEMGPMMLATIKKIPPQSTLKTYYTRAMAISAVAVKIGDVMLEKINAHTMLYLKWITAEAYSTREIGVPIGPDDVCDCICHELSEIKDLLEEVDLPLRRWSMKRHGRIADEIEESLIEEDPNYDPSEESDASKDTDCEDRQLAQSTSRPSVPSKKRPGRKLVHVEKLVAVTVKSNTTVTSSTPPSKKPRQQLVRAC